MNSRRHRLDRSRTGLLAAAWMVAMAPGALAMGPPPADQDVARAISEMRRTLADDVDGQGSSVDGHVIEVRIEDGKATVRIDGRDVPESRVRREGHRIVILDENGQEIDTVPFDFSVGGEGFFGPEQNRWQELFRDFTDAQPHEMPKAMVGIRLGAPGPALEHHLRLDPGTTTMITGVYEGLPAQKAGLHEYDIIVAVDGQSPADPDTLHTRLAAKDAGATVELKVIQEGKPQTVAVTLVPYDSELLARSEFLGHMAGPDVVELENLGGPGGVFWTFPGNRRALIAPDTDDVFIGVPDIDARIREEIERNLPGWRERSGRSRTDQEQQIDRLERRLQELTERLNKLLEEHDR